MIHYKKNIEPIELIEAFSLNFARGNIIKYVARAKIKNNELEDLEKALYYLKREINFTKVANKLQIKKSVKVNYMINK